jgi:glycerophosphoryl diester phosphodiesterase
MRFRKTLGVLALALVGGVLTYAPAAQAAGTPGDHVLGHRCRTYETKVTNENTVEALRDTAEMPGAICEIDAITIADGTVVVVHDGTFRRVGKASTFPAGVTATTRVANTTWAQVSQIRTKGGQPIARLEDMIRAAGQYHIGLYVDMRNRLPNPSALVTLANQVGANVGYYQLLQGNCSHANIDRMRAAGAPVGVKLLGECPTTPAQMQAMGATFTQQISFFMTDAYIADARARGITVGVLDRGMTEATAEALAARGVQKFLLNEPKEALTWFSGD